MFRGGSSHMLLAIQQSWCLDYSPVHNISFTALEKNIVTKKLCHAYPSECTQLTAENPPKNKTGWTFFFRNSVFLCVSGWYYGNFLRWVLFVVGMAGKKDNQHPICQDGFDSWFFPFWVSSVLFLGGRSGKTKRLRFFFHNHSILFREFSNHFHSFIIFLETLEGIVFCMNLVKL